MRTRKQELISDELKPLVSQLLKESREKYNYSLEDLAKALNYQKNRQTLHKYETGKLNIPYDILFEICRIFNIDNDAFKKAPITEEEQKILEKKMIKEYVSSLRKDKDLTPQIEKTINNYKNAYYEPQTNRSELYIKVVDDSMEPVYLKNDKLTQNGEDISKEIIIKSIKSSVINGTTYYYIIDSNNQKYKASIELSDNLPFINNGDKLKVSYLQEEDIINITKID